jgi:hypothetical protein
LGILPLVVCVLQSMRRVHGHGDRHDEHHVRSDDMRNPEPKITMTEGAAYWARITGAPRPHRGTLIRWALKGCRGKRLRAESLAGRWFTTTDAIEEFLRHVTEVPADVVDRTAGPARAAQVQRSLDDLDRMIAPKRPGRPRNAK